MSFILPANHGFVKPAAAGGGGPQPSDLSGLELWLKADAITGVADGGNITTTWPDSSGNARHATSVQGSTDWPIWQATAGPNSTSRVKTYGTTGGTIAGAGWFTLPNFMTGFTAGDVFVVMRKIVKSSALPANCGPPLGDWGSTTGDLFVFNTDQKIYDGTGSSARKTTVDPGDVTTAAFVYEIRTASAAWSNYKNGTQLFTTATNTVSFNSAPFIGHTTSNSARYDGYISEVIFFSRVLDDTTERKAVIHAYLNTKYGFSLPT